MTAQTEAKELAAHYGAAVIENTETGDRIWFTANQQIEPNDIQNDLVSPAGAWIPTPSKMGLANCYALVPADSNHEAAVQLLFTNLQLSAKQSVSGFGDSYSLFWHTLPAAEIQSQLEALDSDSQTPFTVTDPCLPFSTAYATNSYQQFSDFAAATSFMDLPNDEKVRVVRKELELALTVLENREDHDETPSM